MFRMGGMRRYWALALLLAGCGRTGLTELGSGLDGGTGDAPPLGFDAGAKDASTPDAGLGDGGADAGPPDGGSCDPFGPGSVGLSLERPLGEQPRFFEGPMVFLPTGAIRFGARDQSFSLLVDPSQLPDVFLGAWNYYGYVETGGRYGDWKMALYELGPNGPEALLFVAWAGVDNDRWRVEDFEYRYETSSCEAPDVWCGPTVARDLWVGERRIQPGATVRAELLLRNGQSLRHLDSSGCEDIPPVWHEGWAWLGPQDCSDLGRDTCIANPRCILTGSEDRDPGYECVPSRGGCEELGMGDCLSDLGCRWDPGECYCPEGLDCACAGGPAPVCKQACRFSSQECQAGRYCELDTPHCTRPDSSVGGACTLIPRDCSGTPSGPVCACMPGLQGQSFPHDCQRRRARASAPSPDLCP